MIGFTTPGTFDGIMDGETATQGFVGRSIIVTEKDINPEARAGFRQVPLPDQLQHQLAALYSGGSFDVMDRGAARIEYYDDLREIETTPEADKMLLDVATWLHSYADDMGEHTGEASVAMIRRSYEMIAKISFILGIPGGVRNADHVRWAFAYVRQEIDAKIALVFANDNAKDRPEESIAARLLTFIDPDKGASISVLANRIRMKPAAILPILEKMRAEKMVDEVNTNRRYRGKSVTAWVVVKT